MATERSPEWPARGASSIRRKDGDWCGIQSNEQRKEEKAQAIHFNSVVVA